MNKTILTRLRTPIAIRLPAPPVRIRSVLASVQQQAALPPEQPLAHWPQGPVGTAVGAAIGAVAGGLAGKAVAEAVDPTVVDTHWRSRYEREPYYESGMTYDDYAPSYRLGADARARNASARFEEVEHSLARDYDTVKGKSRLELGKSQARSARRVGYRVLDTSSRTKKPRFGGAYFLQRLFFQHM